MPPTPDTTTSLRVEVVDVFTVPGRGTVAVGLVRAGTIRVGDELLIHHGDETSRVACLGIEFHTFSPAASPPRIGLLLGDLDRRHVAPGDTITSAGEGSSGESPR